MTSLRLVLLSLLHFWKTNVAVACGVAVGTAVLSGALLVGDSMRGSLRELVLSGLGNIDEALVADHFFREDLSGDAASKTQQAPVIVQQAGLEAADRDSPARVDQVNVYGCDERFWQLFPKSGERAPGKDDVVLNEPLARLLAVKQGDWVLLSLADVGAIPAESAMGRKKAAVDTMRLRVAAITGPSGVGRFSLRPNQRVPINAYVNLAALQEQLKEPGRVNAIFRAKPGDATAWHPQLADYGIHVDSAPQGYIDITTERLIFSPGVEKSLEAQLRGAGVAPAKAAETAAPQSIDIQPALTYLANSIKLGDLDVPYSTITAIDFQSEPPLGPFVSIDGKAASKLADDDIALNTWAADHLKAKVGDRLAVTYYEPESTTGLLQEKKVSLKLAAIIKLEGAAADKRLTPTVRGLTDKESVSEWKLPFEVKFKSSREQREADSYWHKYGATPKAFVSLATGRRLWASRFGDTTSLRVRPMQGMTAASLAAQLDLDPVEQGFVFRQVRELALNAASGTTPFEGLFLGFSFFVIVAAVMLVVLLFRLGIEQRTKQLGLLLALGFRRRQVSRLLLLEGLVVAAIGSTIGTVAGVGYAAIMLWGLRTWWLPAIGTPFLTLHVTWQSPIIGFAAGLVLALIAIWFTVRRIARGSPRRLLAGEAQYSVRSTQYSVPGKQSKAHKLPARNFQVSFFNIRLAIFLALALLPPLALLLVPMSQDAKIGAFFGAGSWTLIVLLVFAYRQLRAGATGAAVTIGRGNLLRMAMRNAGRHASRSTLAIGLTASACFLIAAVSVFHVDPAHEATDRTGPSGGFALIGQSTLPIYYDLNTAEGRKELGVEEKDAALLATCRFYAFRVKPGDEASCLNLYQPSQPRMLGVGSDFIARDGFSWADAPAGMKNPWEVLNVSVTLRVPMTGGTRSVTDTLPAVLDQSTAQYSLNLSQGQTKEYADAHGRAVAIRVAGVLCDSIFQGDLLLGEESLRRADPHVVGYRYFLIETPPDKTADVQQALQRVLGDYGFQSETTVARLSSLAAVQNTYLATFQSLGGLGLLLGTIGLAVVEWRSVLERRGELALLRAAGYRTRAIGFLVAAENVVLLVAGLAIGILAAIVAVLPSLFSRVGSVPWLMLATIFASVLIVGLLVTLVALRGIVDSPILASLREEK